MAQLVQAKRYNPEVFRFDSFSIIASQLLIEMPTRDISWEVKAASDTFLCRLSAKSGILNILESQRPLEAC